MDEYLATRRGNMRPKTLSETRRIVGYFCTWCETQGLGLEAVKPQRIQEYTEHLQSTRRGRDGGPLSTHTVYLHVTILRAFLSWCAQDEEMEEYVKSGMVRKIKTPKQDTYVIETFSKEQVNALLRACESTSTGSSELDTYLRDRDRAIVMLLLDTGIRAGELVGLTMQHINLSPMDAHVQVFGKGSKWREVGLGERCRKELRRFVHKHGRSQGKLLFSTRRGEPMKEETLFRVIERLGRRAGIKGVRCSPHTFRHTYAVTFMRESGDIYRLSKLLGHTTITTTTNYLKSFTQADARRGAISPLDKAF